MNLDTFFEKFDLFADAPNAVAKMRELILELAVQGKLVPQDCSDEPAALQLARISKQKVNAGRITRAKPGNAKMVNTDAVGASVPRGWTKAPLADLVTVINGRAYSKDELLSCGTPVLRVGNLFTSNYWYYSDLELDADKYCDNGDLIYAWSASFGPFIWTGPKVIYHYHIWKLQFHSEDDLDKRYLLHFLQNRTQEIKRAGHGVSMLHMTKEKMEKLAVTIPPLAEQKRIVAKVDELMALCDRLEAQQQERETRHTALAQASLTRFADAPTPANLPFLFHPSYAISPADLRKSILTLAVQGKLVPQDPNDEPAQLMVERIQNLRDRAARGHKQKSKGASFAVAVEEEFSIPVAWRWCRVDEIALVKLGGTPSRSEPKYWGGSVAWVSSGEVANCRISTTKETITSAGLANSNATIYPPKTVLIAMIGQGKTRGQSAILEISASTNQNVAGLVFDSEWVDPEYVWKWALREYQRTRSGGRGGAQPALNGEKIRELMIPLPPLPEQKRIVAKVEQLMALVDRLEAQLAESRGKAAALLEAVVAEIARAA